MNTLPVSRARGLRSSCSSCPARVESARRGSSAGRATVHCLDSRPWLLAVAGTCLIVELRERVEIDDDPRY